MPVNAQIPLSAQAPTITTPDFAGTMANAIKIKASQLELAKAENSTLLGYLTSSKDQASYDLAKQSALSDPNLSEQTKQKIMQAPEVYDPGFINNMMMAGLTVKDRLDLANKQYEREFDREKFEEQKRHNTATEGKANIPSGYQAAGDGRLTYIPGGPADPNVKGAPNPKDIVGVEKSLRDDFQTQSKEWATTSNFYQRGLEGKKAADAGNPQGDQTLIYSFMKLQDPTSVVMPGEYATAGSFKGVSEGLIQAYNKALKGDALSPQQRNNLAQQLDALFATKANQQLKNEQDYTAMSQRNQADPRNVLIGVPTVAGVSPTFPGLKAPNPQQKITDVVMGLESGGRRYGNDGQPLISSKGAQGEMQVMDATNTQPGFGVAPAKDSSLDERARVGRDYINAMVQRYGDNAKALAAYNAGPGAVDKAVKEGGENWLSKLPKETRDYVNNGMAKMQSNQRPSLPNLATPQAAQIKAAYQAGKLTKEQAKAQLQALGS